MFNKRIHNELDDVDDSEEKNQRTRAEIPPPPSFEFQPTKRQKVSSNNFFSIIANSFLEQVEQVLDSLLKIAIHQFLEKVNIDIGQQLNQQWPLKIIQTSQRIRSAMICHQKQMNYCI